MDNGESLKELVVLKCFWSLAGLETTKHPEHKQLSWLFQAKTPKLQQTNLSLQVTCNCSGEYIKFKKHAANRKLLRRKLFKVTKSYFGKKKKKLSELRCIRTSEYYAMTAVISTVSLFIFFIRKLGMWVKYKNKLVWAFRNISREMIPGVKCSRTRLDLQLLH